MSDRPPIALILAVLFTSAIGAQQPQLPPRDIPRDRSVASTGTIAGVVRAADTGMPLRGADIRVNGAGLPGGARGAFTDAEGRYEFTGLPEGQYTLTASKVRYMTMTYGQTRVGEEGRTVQVASGQRAEGIDFGLPAGSVIVLRVGDRFGDPAVGLRVTLYQAKPGSATRALAQMPGSAFASITDDRGEIRLSGLAPGEYYVSVAGSPGPVVPPGDGGGPTFYPGVPAEADARPITVGLGEEVIVAFDVVASRTARISGTIVSAVRPDAFLERRTGAGQTMGNFVSVAADGTFSVANLTPGEYVLTARTANELGTLTVLVGDEDVSGLELTMRPVLPIRGRLTFEGAVPPAVAPTAFVLRPVFPGGGLSLIAQYKPDWTFEIPPTGGSGVLRFDVMPRGWFLKAVLLDGRDVTDTALDFDAYRGRPLEVIVTQSATEISGRVADAAGGAVTNFVAVAFADDPQRWTPLTRAIASARPDQQGRFSIRGLPPGRYLVAAVDYLPQGQERDPKTLERLRGGATAVTLIEGAEQNVTVQIAP